MDNHDKLHIQNCRIICKLNGIDLIFHVRGMYGGGHFKLSYNVISLRERGALYTFITKYMQIL